MKITEEMMKQNAETGAAAGVEAGTDSETGTTASAGSGSVDTAGSRTGSRSDRLTEREKLRSMSRSDRLWYIWAYYKLHFAGALVALIVLYVVGLSIYNSTIETALHCIYINNRTQEEVSLDPLEKDFADYAGFGRKEQVIAEASFISFGDDATEYSYASMAKITALVASKDLDVIVSDTEATYHYASMDAFLDLEQNLSPDLLTLVQDRLYYATCGDGVSRPIAIDLSGTDFVSASGLVMDPPLLSIISNSVRTDNAEALIRYIFAP